MEYKLFAVRVFVTEGSLPSSAWIRPARKAGRSSGALSAPLFRFLISTLRARRWPSVGSNSPRRPEEQPWGGILAHLRDPDGNILTLLGNSD